MRISTSCGWTCVVVICLSALVAPPLSGGPIIVNERIFRFTSQAETRQLVLNGGAATLNAVDSGWFDQTGAHEPDNTNYIVGGLPPETIYRNFFVFDIAAPISAISATLVVGCSNPNCYLSPDPTETYTLYNYAGLVGHLTAGGSGLTYVWEDLGSGPVYGSVVVSAANCGGSVSIPLNANALAALNAMSTPGQFAIGGALTSLQQVPEPATLTLVGLGLGALLLARSKHQPF